MTTSRDLALCDIYAARRRLTGYVSATPLRYSDWLSSESDAHVHLKLESLQPTNAFKLRGAMHAALCLIERNAARTVVTASAGNHGRAIALAAARLGLHATVFTPAGAPDTKKQAIRRLGATLRDDAEDYDAAEQLAREYAHESDAVYISPYNHPDVIAGAGTIGLEILEAAPETDVVVVPVGGGGLASGVALALKAVSPRIVVVGVEVEASRPFAAGIAHGEITKIDVRPSLADGLIGNLEPASITFDLVRRYVDRLVSVSEAHLRRAIRGLAAEEHLVTEGAGATATAALLYADAANAQARVVVLHTGSNIDLQTFAEVISTPAG